MGTKLDAANHFTVDHLEEAKNWKVVESAKAVYSAGFFLTVSVDSMLKVGRYCAANNKTYCLNLSAPFLIQFFKDQMMSVMPYLTLSSATRRRLSHSPRVSTSGPRTSRR